MLVSNVIKQAGDSEDIYKMAIRYYFSHLRAWLVESPNLKKNRTVQNYLLLYERQDLLTEVNQVLELHVTEDWTLRYLIMTLWRHLNSFLNKVSNISLIWGQGVTVEQIISKT